MWLLTREMKGNKPYHRSAFQAKFSFRRGGRTLAHIQFGLRGNRIMIGIITCNYQQSINAINLVILIWEHWYKPFPLLIFFLYLINHHLSTEVIVHWETY